MTCGIYGITNNESEAMYVGRAEDINKRFLQHCNVQPIDLAIANEGVNNFTLSVIEELPFDLNLLKERERYWIKYYNVENDPKHYNIGLSKYSLWDASYCRYEKHSMYRNNRELNPCRCFRYTYDNYRLPMGRFEDFVSCEVIYRLVEDALK